MEASLNLDDLDPLDLQIAVERAFDIRIADSEAVKILTVGDLEDAVMARLPDVDADGPCLTTMAFHRLRAAQDVDDFVKLAPSSALKSGIGGPKGALRQMERRSGLRLPGPRIGSRGGLGMVLISLAFAVFSVGSASEEPFVSLLLVALLAATAIWLVRTDKGRFPEDATELGQLSRLAVDRNYGRLVAFGGRFRQQEARDHLL